MHQVLLVWTPQQPQLEAAFQRKPLAEAEPHLQIL
jgi:hypothetical protein